MWLESKTLSVDDLLGLAQRGKLRVPNFQRLYRWNPRDVSGFFDSIARGFPTGILLFWEAAGEEGHEKLGPVPFHVSADSAAWFVVDGQQRITTLVAALLGKVHDPAASRFSVSATLTDPPAFHCPPRDGNEAVALPLSLIADTVELIEWQTGLRDRGESAEVIRRASQIAKSIREYRFPVLVAHDASEPEIQDVYVRINQQGHRLSKAEVFHALGWSRAGKSWPVIDFQHAARNVRVDVAGDWISDPFGWPELRYLGTPSARALLEARVRDTGVRHVFRIDVPKSAVARRPAVQLDIVDRVVYQALVDRLSPALHGDLSSNVHGYRLPAKSHVPGLYGHQWWQWTAYGRRLAVHNQRFAYALETDIGAFFASVDQEILEGVVAEAGRVAKEGLPTVARLTDLVRQWNAHGVAGLPQRCLASSALANAILRPVDADVDAWQVAQRPGAKRGREGAGWLRWMDDYTFFGRSRDDLADVQVRFEDGLRRLKLSINAGKTRWSEQDARHGILEVRRAASASDDGGSDAPMMMEGLRERVLNDPETVDTGTARFVLGKEDWSAGVPEAWLEVLGHLPHAADRIARQVARQVKRPELLDQLAAWYLDYLDRPMSRIAWSRTHLLGMFGATPPGTVVDRLCYRLRANLVDDAEYATVVAAIGSSKLVDVRPLLRSEAEGAESPWRCRSSTLQLVRLGLSVDDAAPLLERFPELQVSADALRALGSSAVFGLSPPT